jgi:hypothetical protein
MRHRLARAGSRWSCWVLAAALAASCSPAPLPPPPTIAPDCQAAVDPGDDDIALATRFTGNVFASSSWERSLSSEPYRVTVSWLNHDEGAVAHLEYLIYSCGASPADLEAYFSDENFETVIFQDYQNLALQRSCTRDDAEITLRHFTAQHQGTDYVIRYWVMPYGPARVIDLLLVFPAPTADRLEPFAAALFPELSSCG